MTDQELERRLRSWYRAQISDAVRAPLALRTSVAAIPVQQRWVVRLPWAASTNRLSFRLAAAALIGIVAVGGAFYLLRPAPSQVGSPSPTPAATAGRSPTASPSPTGPMGVGRQIQTSTLLADGRVLVAGGFDASDAALALAELYDPQTGSFRSTGSMATARGVHTATRLLDGRVLIAGGGAASWVVSGPFLASAELYDPATGTFSPTGSMTVARTDHTATLLLDGRVLITGGNDVGDHGIASAEIYDPKTGTFSPTGSMTTARGFHTATLLLDGRVLIVGGEPAAWTGSGPFLASAEIYDPRTGRFTATGQMTIGRTHHAATRLADGRILITGGTDFGGDSLFSAEIYDPKTGTFTATGRMSDGRVYHTSTPLADGRVLIVGGSPGGVDYANRPFLASAEIYDPIAGTFTATGSMADHRTWHAAALLDDGRVLVTGGYGDLAPLASAEIYDPRTGAFSPVR